MVNMDYSSLSPSHAPSDLSLIVGDENFRVHKAIVCAESDYFKALCMGNFMEANQREIELVDDPSCAIRAMLDHMYGVEYKEASETASYNLLQHTRVIEICDKYMITSLLEKAVELYRSCLYAVKLDEIFDLIISSPSLQEIKGVTWPLEAHCAREADSLIGYGTFRSYLFKNINHPFASKLLLIIDYYSHIELGCRHCTHFGAVPSEQCPEGRRLMASGHDDVAALGCLN